MAFDKAKYALVLSILAKSGVADAGKLEPDRAVTKLRKRLTKGGTPEGLTPEEGELAEHIKGGGTLEGTDTPAEAKPEKTPKQATPAATKPAPAEGQEEYKLSKPGEPDRTENLDAKTAAARNKRRTDGRKWVHVGNKGGKATNKPQAAPKAAKATPAPKGGAKPTSKAAGAAAPAPATGEAKPKGTRKSSNRESGGCAAFRKLLEGGKPMKKQAVVDALVEAGVSEPTARSYVVWAKRSPKNKIDNPFGFKIVETKDAKTGEKTVCRA